MTFNFVCVFVFAACFNVALTAEDAADHYQEQNVKERPVGRSYSLTTCDYKTQTGFTCLTCTRALHCYAGNIAIIVDCYGLFRYCRDGRCSRFQGEKCADNKFTTQGPFNATIQIDAANVAATSEATTRIVTGVTESVAETATETSIIPIDEKVTTKSDNSTVTPVDEKMTTQSDNTTTLSPVDEKATTKSDVSSTTVIDISSNVV